MSNIIWDYESVWQKFDLKINTGHCDLYFMVQWFCRVSWRLFDVCTSYFGSMNQYDLMFDLKINVGHCTYIPWFSDFALYLEDCLDHAKRIWYLLPMRAAKVQASPRIRAVSPEPPLLAHTSSESRGTFRQKARSLAPLNGWACAVTICHDGMLEDTNSLDGAHLMNEHYYLGLWVRMTQSFTSK